MYVWYLVFIVLFNSIYFLSIYNVLGVMDVITRKIRL